MPNNKKTISISSELFNIISTRIKNPQSGFSSVEEYVNYVLKEVFESEGSFEEEGPEISEDDLSKEENEKVRKELKKLGYI